MSNITYMHNIPKKQPTHIEHSNYKLIYDLATIGIIKENPYSLANLVKNKKECVIIDDCKELFKTGIAK